ncbi:hypothetical protein AAFN85_02000 [Mucilaginibacter sp. CAU 1740]|uniref:hypothetical protein n=1 Tax=Mucilaginibacter sp. CAU 1740 TaxID=3140365 RepID=UPI00325BC9BF
MIRYFTAFLLSIVSITAYAQDVCTQLTKLKQECYGFKPETLNDAQQQAKSAQLDKFWELAKSDKKSSVPCLRAMIKAENNDPYFCFDASSLLLSLDESAESLDAILAGAKKSTLDGLQLESYLQLSFYLGKKGLDVSALAEKLISYPNAHIPLIQHAITLNAIDACLFLYNTIGDAKAEQSLINTITNGNETGRNNAAVVLNLISTNRGDSLINKLIAQKQLPDSVSKFILKDRESFTTKADCKATLSRESALQKARSQGNDDEDYICAASKALKPEDADAVREARYKTIRGLSDEGLGRYFRLTALLMNIRHK